MPGRQVDPHGRFDHAVAFSSEKSSSTSACWSASSVFRNALAALTTAPTPVASLSTGRLTPATDVPVCVSVEAFAIA